jgi:NADP-dependent 3-hydroxy acid dehydrogenase YdfG
VTAFGLATPGFVRLVRAVVPHMRAQRRGRIIGIQSTSVQASYITGAAYQVDGGAVASDV